jgi:hypothetical protein
LAEERAVAALISFASPQDPRSHNGSVPTSHGALMAGISPASNTLIVCLIASPFFAQVRLVQAITYRSVPKMPGGIHAPIEEITRWPTPNYVNPITRPNTVLLVACICGPITFTMLMARLWVRIVYQRNSGWDDWLVVAGTVSSHNNCNDHCTDPFQIPTIAVTVLFPLGKFRCSRSITS